MPREFLGLQTASASMTEVALAAVLNFWFMEGMGMYNGSTFPSVSVSPPYYDVRELPIIGGTGHFRMAYGFAVIHNYKLSADHQKFVLEFNITNYQ